MTWKSNHLPVISAIVVFLLLLRSLGLKELLLLLMFWRRNITEPLPRNSGRHVQTPSAPPMKPSSVVLKKSYGGPSHHWRPFRSLIETLERLVFFAGLLFILLALTWWIWVRPSRPIPPRTSPAVAAENGKAPASSLDSTVNSDHRKTPAPELPVNPTTMSITHQSFLKSFFNENPGQNGLSGKQECSLMEWLQNRKALGIGPLAEFKVPGSSTTVTYVREDIKVLIRYYILQFSNFHLGRWFGLFKTSTVANTALTEFRQQTYL